MHIFCHRDRPHPFEDRGDEDWMSRYFFSGGIMPSVTTLAAAMTRACDPGTVQMFLAKPGWRDPVPLGGPIGSLGLGAAR